MKFSFALTALVLAASASAASIDIRAANQFGQGANKGGNNAGKGGAGKAGNNAGKGGAAATAGKGGAAAATTTAAAAASSSAAASGSGGDQSSLTLDQSVIATGFEQNGQESGAEPGQVPSLTSSNNFINFCATVNKPITNGKQITTGSCNPAPMGVIAAQTNMPASKFVNPKNLDTIPANQAFTITMNIKNLVTGNFVNAQTNYYSAPQQVDGSGNIIGHSHFVVEQLQSLTQTTPLDNTKFAFFQGVNTAADGQGNLNVQVTKGLPAGVYRVASINAAANHQPALVAVAQHGSLDDMVYFTVSNNGAAASNSTAGAGTANSATTAAAATATAAKGKGTTGANKGGNTGKGAFNNGGKAAGAQAGKGKRFQIPRRAGLNRL